MMGAIISLPMQAPNKGILQGVLILFFTLFMLRAVNWLGFKNGRLEKLFQGEMDILVKDGVLQKDVQEKTKITNQQVFEDLRNKEIYNLTRVKWMYIEALGFFSIYKEEKENMDFLCIRKLTKPSMIAMRPLRLIIKPVAIAGKFNQQLQEVVPLRKR